VWSEQYLARVEKLMGDLGAEPVQGQLKKAAAIISRDMAGHRVVGVSSITHFVMWEMFWNTRVPWKPFNVVWKASTAFSKNLKPGELLLWIGYIGLGSPNEDYGRYIRESKVRFITSFVPDRDPDKNAGDAVAHIGQSWTIGDGVIETGFPPFRLAPISGINSGLLFRMLDETVADMLDSRPRKM
jgi:hypothetical protein